jgi:hypothetical protein
LLDPLGPDVPPEVEYHESDEDESDEPHES